MVARVRLEVPGSPANIQAHLIDVSAGGLRASYIATEALEEGREVEVEITVQDAADARHPPLVNLRGRGRVVRLGGDLLDEVREAALEFTDKLTVREPFSQMLLF